jgi:hypothetical protein
MEELIAQELTVLSQEHIAHHGYRAGIIYHTQRLGLEPTIYHTQRCVNHNTTNVVVFEETSLDVKCGDGLG